jgi:hypothetical protein
MTAARLCELFVMLRSFQSSNRLERVAILGRRRIRAVAFRTFSRFLSERGTGALWPGEVFAIGA